jgi:hypothetical protein
MAKYLWRDLPFNKEAKAQPLNNFCRRGLEKDLPKPGKTALFQIVLKYMVASGDLIIDRFEEGVSILRRGDSTHVSEDVTVTGHDVTANVTPAPTQETDLTIGSQSQSQSQQCHGQTPSQLAHEEVRLAKVAFEKAPRIAQERLQEEA